MTVKFSLLTLQGLLSGEISHEKFVRDHDMLNRYIANSIKSGQMISKIEIEHCPDEDDDWVSIEFDRTAPDHLFPR